MNELFTDIPEARRVEIKMAHDKFFRNINDGAHEMAFFQLIKTLTPEEREYSKFLFRLEILKAKENI